MQMQELKRWREELNISMDEAAKHIHVSQTTIGNYENGIRKPSATFKKAYEDFLHRVESGEIKCKKRKHAGYSNNDYTEGARELQKVREKLGIAQFKVAIELNIPPASLSHYERGEYKMPIDKFKAYKSFLRKIKLDRIFGKNRHERYF